LVKQQSIQGPDTDPKPETGKQAEDQSILTLLALETLVS
jgi:hypothetical protein